MKRFLSYILSGIFILIALCSNAQNYQPDELLKQDPEVITGELKNGLKYYIRPNHKPEKRVEFRLVVNAGSILEDDDQLGLAHFVEHMAFNGTEHFSKNELIGFLEESGVSFGADLNASTSFDETIYMFQMPSDRKGLLDSAFMVLEDWAHNLLFEDEEIDKERGVIREEWRMGLGANNRMQKKYLPVLLKDSRYAERIPIGKMEVIDTFEYDVIKRFYRDWYRPDLMAVIVVGDIDPAYAEKQINNHFNAIKRKKKERERKAYEIPNNSEPLIAVASDKEATLNIVAILYKLNKSQLVTVEDYRRYIMLNLYSMMLNARYFELSQKPSTPFIFANANYGSFLSRSTDTWENFAAAKENRIEETLSMLVKENERVKKFGFTENELIRQKAEILSNLEKAVKEKDKTESSRFANEYISHFLDNEACPGIENEYKLTKLLLPGISLQDVNVLSDLLVTENNQLVLVTGSEKEGNRIPVEKDLNKTIIFAKRSKLKPYEEKVLATSLIDEALEGGKLIDSNSNKMLGYTEYTLDNGIKIILKPTTYKNDEILMTAFNEGGTSIVHDSVYFTSSLASSIVVQGGVGEFSKVDLTKFLSGKKVSVTPRISTLTQNISGASTKKDLETMLQLTYLYFTQPRKDQEAFEAFQSQLSNQFKFLMANPQAVFVDTLYKLATSNDPRTVVIPTEEQIFNLDLDQALSFYKDRYADAEGFRFFFVGSFNVDSLTPHLVKYLGSLPSTNREDNWIDVNPEFPGGITDVVVHKGTEPKSSVALMMDSEFEWTRFNRMNFSILMKILDIRMRESMREDQGGVYGVSTDQQLAKYPTPEYTLTISWGCNPENVDTLVNTVFGEMKTLITNGPVDVNLKKAKETTIRDLETNAKKNQYWLNVLKNSYYYDEDILSIETKKRIIEDITSEDIQKAAGKYFSKDHYIKVVLLPEEEITE